MDDELKDLYETELKHLRTHADEFAARAPFRRIATRLGLSPNAALRDPFVEWLLQGYAFLAARVHRKLEAEFPRFTQNLLSVVYPHLSAPTPSMIIAEFAMKPDPGLLDTGALLPRESRLSMSVRERDGGAARRARRVTFTTGRPVRLWPLKTTAVRYLPDTAAVIAAGASRPAPAGIAVTLALTPAEASVAALGADTLDLFCPDVDGGGAALFEALALSGAQAEVTGGGRSAPVGVAPLGLDRDLSDPSDGQDACDSLLPYGPRSFDGWRLLHEFLALPSRFQFLRLSGLRSALAGRSEAEISLVFQLPRPWPRLAGRLGPEALRPNCVPAVNLFRHRADDLAITGRRIEHHVQPDRGDPTGFEVHSVLDVRGVSHDGEALRFRPYFAADGFGARAGAGRRYYHVTRTPRVRPLAREERDDGLDIYVGTETWISIVDDTARPADAGLKALSVDVLCTNRHLASFGLVDMGGAPQLTSELDGGWSDIRVIAGPSAPRTGLPEGRRLWDAISHLSLNHLALVDAEGDTGAGAATLRQLLRLYAPETDATAQRLVDSVQDVRAEPTISRLPPRAAFAAAPMAFARGLSIALTIDDTVAASATLAAVLDRVLAGQAEANSFIETRLLHPDGRERLRLPPRSGTRPML